MGCHITIIDIEGELFSTQFASPYSQRGLTRDVVTSVDFTKRTLDYFSQDRTFNAFVFRINSTGSSSSASEEIAKSIKRLDVVTVAFIDGQVSSTAYEVASSADVIFISPSSSIINIGEIEIAINKLHNEREVVCKASSNYLRNLTDGESVSKNSNCFDCQLFLNSSTRNN